VVRLRKGLLARLSLAITVGVNARKTTFEVEFQGAQKKLAYHEKNHLSFTAVLMQKLQKELLAT